MNFMLVLSYSFLIGVVFFPFFYRYVVNHAYISGISEW